MSTGLHLREKKKAPDSKKTGEVEVELTQPFSLEQSAECGQAFRWERSGDSYYSVLGDVVLKVRQEGAKLFARLCPDRDCFSTLSLVGDVFRFDDNVDGIIAELSADPLIAESVSSHRGLRLIRQDPWECLISYLCSINSNIPRIKGDVERLSRKYGREIAFDGRPFYTFPSVDALAGAEEDELRKLKTGFRAKYIVSAARKVKDEKIDLISFRKRSYEDAFEELCTFNGVGPKVADCVLLFSMDKLEAFPVDRWVRRGVELVYFGGRKLTEKRVREWSRMHFGRFAGYAQEYLFYGSRLRELAAGITSHNVSAGADKSVSPAGNRQN